MKTNSVATYIAAILIVGTALTWVVMGYLLYLGGLDFPQLKIVVGILATGMVDCSIQSLRCLLFPSKSRRMLPMSTVLAVFGMTLVFVALPMCLIWLQGKNTMGLEFPTFALILGATQPVLVLHLRYITKLLFPPE